MAQVPDTVFVVGYDLQQLLPTQIYVTPTGGTQKTLADALQASGASVSSFNTRTGAIVLLAADIAALDLSGLPTSDPGGGKVWLNGGVLQVGP